MKKDAAIITCLILFVTSCYGQTKKVYHEYEQTASDFNIVRWNISKDNLPNYHLSEEIDKYGRVIEIKFYENNSTVFDRLCYLVSWIKFDYPDDSTIIQYNLTGYGETDSSFECESPSKVTYYLSKDQKQILSSQIEFRIDTSFYLKNGWTIEGIKETLQEIKANQKTYQTVEYYSKSIAKYNGKFPVSNEFEIESYSYNSIEKEEIEKGLKIE
jgi:hypothetical protein